MIVMRTTAPFSLSDLINQVFREVRVERSLEVYADHKVPHELQIQEVLLHLFFSLNFVSFAEKQANDGCPASTYA